MVDSHGRRRQALEFCQCVDLAAVIGGAFNDCLHDGQITGSDACQAQCLQIGQCGGRATGCRALDGVDGVGNRLEFGQSVCGCAGESSDRVIECTQVVGVQ